VLIRPHLKSLTQPPIGPIKKATFYAFIPSADLSSGKKLRSILFLLKGAFVLLIGLKAVAVLAADPLPAFMGIELGSDISKTIQDKRFKCRRADSPVAELTCRLGARYEEDVYGVPLSSLTLNYFNRKLRAIVITFDSAHFKAVKEGLEQAYGPFQERLVERYVTRRARVFKGYVYIWAKGPFFIDAIEYFSAGSDSAVLYKLESHL